MRFLKIVKSFQMISVFVVTSTEKIRNIKDHASSLNFEPFLVLNILKINV